MSPDDARRAASSARGRLLVVGTPIGNLGDLAPRAAAALADCDLVVAEDTRVAAKLLAHLSARKPVLSMNDHNLGERLPALLARLAGGQTLALTTDAGMPGVSDPGAALVAAARAAGAAIEVVPGPSAATAAVAVSGVAASGFLFIGFLPARPASSRRAALERALEAAAVAGVPIVLFESPHRIRGLLAQIATLAPGSHLVVCRELTKRHEQVLTGSPDDVAAALSEERGEFTLVVDAPAAERRPRPPGALDAENLARSARGMGLSDRTVVELLAAAGVRRREAYRWVHKPPVTPG